AFVVPKRNNTVWSATNDSYRFCPSIPALGKINGSTIPCEGSIQTYSIQTIPGVTDYFWSVPVEWVIVHNFQTSIQVIVGPVGGIVAVPAKNSCGQENSSLLGVNVKPSHPAGPITGPTTTCVGSTQIYSIQPIPGVIKYLWSVPTSWTI